jgi:hypothetical protein
MGISTVPVGWEDVQDEPGCAYILDECESRRICGAPRKAVSPYCPEHHVLCHVAYGSEAEADHLRQVEAIAKVVGGRRSRYSVKPSGQFLKRIEQAARGFSRSNRS